MMNLQELSERITALIAAVLLVFGVYALFDNSYREYVALHAERTISSVQEVPTSVTMVAGNLVEGFNALALNPEMYVANIIQSIRE